MSSQTGESSGLRPIERIIPADAGDYEELVFCPACGNRVEDDVATPHVPVELLVDDQLVIGLQETGHERVPFFGYECARHRENVHLIAPDAIAPASYVATEVVLGDTRVTGAIPRPIYEQASECVSERASAFERASALTSAESD